MHVDRKLRLLPIPRKLGLQVLCGRRCRRRCEVAGTLPCLLLPRARPGRATSSSSMRFRALLAQI